MEEKNKQYDLYLLDIFMEESMNGIELAEKLRRMQEEALICFVSTSDDFYREAYDLYAVQYLIKPVGEESVKKLLRKAQVNLDRCSEKEKILCTNPYINATLAYYGRKLEEISAVCRMDIQIGEEQLPYMGLCRILADGLENAYDALKNLRKTNGRFPYICAIIGNIY